MAGVAFRGDRGFVPARRPPPDGRALCPMMSVRRPRTPPLSDDERSAIRRLVERPLFELIPLRDALERAESLPPGAVDHGDGFADARDRVDDRAVRRADRGRASRRPLTWRRTWSVTACTWRSCSSGARRAASGTRSSWAEMRRIRGEIHDGLALLRLMDEVGHPFEAAGRGRATPRVIPRSRRRSLLSLVAGEADVREHVTTQMSFDVDAISSWISRIRGVGVTLPVHLGLPGAVDVRRLLRVATRIGVGGSLRYLGKNRQLLRSPLPQVVHARASAPLARSHARRSGDGRARASISSRSTRWRRPSRGRSGCWTGLDEPLRRSESVDEVVGE